MDFIIRDIKGAFTSTAMRCKVASWRLTDLLKVHFELYVHCALFVPHCFRAYSMNPANYSTIVKGSLTYQLLRWVGGCFIFLCLFAIKPILNNEGGFTQSVYQLLIFYINATETILEGILHLFRRPSQGRSWVYFQLHPNILPIYNCLPFGHSEKGVKGQKKLQIRQVQIVR